MSRRPSTHETSNLTPLMFQILLSLSQGERHGYSVLQEIEERTGGTFGIGAGTMYRSIKQLVDAGLITEGKRKPDIHRQRRYYRLSPAGKRRAAAEAHFFHGMVAWAKEAEVLET